MEKQGHWEGMEQVVGRGAAKSHHGQHGQKVEACAGVPIMDGLEMDDSGNN